MKKYRYIILNKPFGYLSQFSGEGDHKTLAEFSLPKEVYAAGRLDKDSEGLLLLSNDGPFIEQFLLHHERGYWVQVEGEIHQQAINNLESGINLKTGRTKPCQAKTINEPDLWQRTPPIRQRKDKPTSWLEIILTEGKNRQVRKMTAAVGYPTLRLVRFQLGKISLNSLNLDLGKWIEVKKDDIEKK